MTVNLRRKWVPFPRRLLKSSYLLNFCSIWNIPRKFKNYWQLQSLNGATKTGAYLALLFHEKSRFIAMPLGGTPFAISECMHYGYIVSKTESQTYTREGPLSAKG
ncbi:hypothetical protein T4B_13512 [Trichinella pseudospiralis]|uniref:Uncharacterized protein n=1 Tax=Trichinella pseudospiralis TaxID=6337 RepID=A0A0V1GQ95_TRIPS|nr:hypothetical protein T4B_13512 [Trichinella pseudospiralis]